MAVSSALTPVASNLRQSRMKRGLSLSALAGAAGVAKSTLSELERGRGNPSLDTLWALAQALNVPLGALFDDSPLDGVRILPLDDAEVIADEAGLVTRHLLSLHGRGEVELYVLTLAPGSRRHFDGHGVGQVEHAIGLSGRAEVGLDESSAELGPGDLISFPCDRPHHYHAPGDEAHLLVLQDYP